jgi:hypothetical protein
LVQAQVPARGSFGTREQAALELANEVCRRYLEQDLQQLADSHSDQVCVDTRLYRRHEHGRVAYHSLCGDVIVERCSYRLASVHNGPTIIPLDLEAGIVEGATPALAYSVAEGMAEMPSRRYEQVLRAAHRKLPSRSTIERLAKTLGDEMKGDIRMLEGIVRCHEKLPKRAHAISIGLDRTTVPMAEERAASPPPSSRRKPRTTPRVRRAPAPIDVCYRMAYVGTVAVVDKNGDALVTRKYAATAEEGPHDLVARVMDDVARLRAQRQLPVVVVQDGASELWGLMYGALADAGIKKKDWNLVLDRYHVTERIGTVLEILERDRDKRAAQFAVWRARLDKSDQAVSRFCDWMLHVTRDRPNLQNRIWTHYTYLDGNSLAGRTRYRSFAARGFPTASGVTEGACKSLITARCKRSGQRWRNDGLTAILTLRAVAHSDRMHTIWPLFVRRYRDHVKSIH